MMLSMEVTMAEFDGSSLSACSKIETMIQQISVSEVLRLLPITQTITVSAGGGASQFMF